MKLLQKFDTTFFEKQWLLWAHYSYYSKSTYF